MKIVNTDILSHPVNWVSIPLMVLLALLVAHFVLTHVRVSIAQGGDQ